VYVLGTSSSQNIGRVLVPVSRFHRRKQKAVVALVALEEQPYARLADTEKNVNI